MNASSARFPLAKWFAAGIGLSLVLLLGRVTGFVRELLIAAQFGAERTADQLIVLLTLPDILTNLLTTGAMLYVLVPEFRRSGAGRANALFRQASLYVVALLGSVALVAGFIFPTPTLYLFAPGFSDGQLAAMAWALPLFLLLAPITGLTSISTAWLQSRERFFLPAFGTIILNLALIGGLLAVMWTSRPFLSVGCALLLGGALRYASQVVALKPSRKPRTMEAGVIDWNIGARYLTALLAGGLFLLFPVIARAFASATDGGIAVFNYAIKLADLPLGIAITVLPLMLLPRMTDALDRGAPGHAQEMSRASLFATLAVALSIALPAAWFAPSVVAILYGWTGIEPVDLQRIASLATIAFLAIPAQGAIAHCMSVLNAANLQRTVLSTSALALGILLITAWGLRPTLGLPGLMVALAVGYLVGWFVFAIRGTRVMGWHVGDFGFNRQIAKLVGAATAVGGLVISLGTVLPTMVAFDVVLGALWCAGTLAAAALIYRAPSR